ncbi:S-layer homology domain-containing protein [Candidatus Dojkabacteria bacterium]|nr:S-layer homology domain-containing protein [Candidatus Dojkabacteria bacterium]
MKKLLVLGILFLFLFSPVKATLPPPAFIVFSDVSNHIYEEAIDYVYQERIVNGYSDGTFRPDNLITRGEFTKIIIASTLEEGKMIMLCSIMSDPGPGYVFTAPPPEFYEEKDFIDVKREDTFGDYICYAKTNNIISGYSDGTFRPDENITVGQASKIISNAFGFTTASDIDSGNTFLIYIDKLYGRIAIPAEISSKDSYLTRGQMVEIIYRLKNYITNKTQPDYKLLTGNALSEDCGVVNLEQTFMGLTDLCKNELEIKCNQLSGVFQDYGYGRYVCSKKSSDGGKICKDSSECEFGCYILASGNQFYTETGTCSQTKYFRGCFTEIQYTKPNSPPLCGD